MRTKARKSVVKAAGSARREFAPLPNRGDAALTRAHVAALLSVTPRTLDRMIAAGQYPRADFRMPDPETGDPRWRLATHDAWMRRRSGAEESEE